MYVAALVLDAAAACWQLACSDASLRGRAPGRQRRPAPTTPYGPTSQPAQSEKLKAISSYTGIGGLKLRGVTLEGIGKCSNI